MNPYDTDQIATIGPVVESVAAQVSRRYHQYGGSQDDLSSEGWLWVYEHPLKVLTWLEDDNPKFVEKMLARTLHNELSDYGEDLKAQHLGYSRDDLAYYSRAMVRELLPSVFDPEAWLHPEQAEGERRGRSVPAEGGNWIATLADVARAFGTLSLADKDLLLSFHRDGRLNKDLARQHGVTEQTMSYRHDQTIKRLVDALGGPKVKGQHDADCDHAWRGGRRAMSNAQARSIQSGYYDE